MLEVLLNLPATSVPSAAPLNVVVATRAMRFDVASLTRCLQDTAAGDCVAFAVRLDGPAITRLATLAVVRMLLWRARRAMERSGARVVGTYGVDPDLDTPAFVYELNTPAAEYARRYLSPRGSFQVVRLVVARLVGCDPALGAVVIVARKL